MCFQIPCYQRRYCWSENDCKVLLDDIQALAEEHSAGNDQVPHFMGSIVVQEEDSGTKWQIIDGQQRLVTMYLFYLALAQAAKDRKVSVPGLTDIEKSNIFSSEPKFIFPKSNQELEDISDQDALAAICSCDVSLETNEDDAFSEHPIVKNYRWFYKQLMATYKDGIETKFEFPDLIKLFKSTQKIELVKLSLDNYDKPQFIFESLNAKGEPLEDWDKIRNLVLMDLPAIDLDIYYQKFWLPIENYTESDTEFVCYYLIAKEGMSSNINRYTQFKQYIHDKGFNINNKKNLLKSMLAYAKLYAFINTNFDHLPCLQNESEYVSRNIKQMLYFLKSSSCWKQWIPFGMQCIMMYRNGKITANQLLKVLKLIDIFLVRSFVCNFKQREEDEKWYFADTQDKYKTYLKAVFLSLCNEFKTLKPGNDFVNSVRDFLFVEHRVSQNIIKWESLPKNINDRVSLISDIDDDDDDGSFKRIINECHFYDATPQYLHPALIYIIARLEAKSSGGVVKAKTFADVLLREGRDKATIEHILPQTLDDDWVYYELGVNDRRIAKSIYKNWIDRLANLTLLTQSENSTIGNSSFKEKLKCYKDKKKSPLLYNSEVVNDRKIKNKWNEANLEHRAEIITRFASELWGYSNIY